MDKPSDGPVGKYGPFIRGAQPIGKGFFLVDTQGTTKGKGKVWRPAIVRRNPKYLPGGTDWNTCSEWELCARTDPQRGKYTIADSVKTTIWWDDANDKRCGIEGYFPDELTGVQFMVRAVPDFVTP